MEIHRHELQTYKRDTRRFRDWKIRRFIRNSRTIMAAAYAVAIIKRIFKGDMKKAMAYLAVTLPVLTVHFA